MKKQINTVARERVLLASERLFAERGYQAVSLRDIAQDLGLQHASLYHHIPQGKEELFVEVTTRRLQRSQEHLREAIALAPPGWQERLRAAANWFLAQPAMHLSRMLQSDMQQISTVGAEKLRVIILRSMLEPINEIFAQAFADNPAKLARSTTFAGMFFSLIEGIDNLPPTYVVGSKQELVDIVLDVFLHGIVP